MICSLKSGKKINNRINNWVGSAIGNDAENRNEFEFGCVSLWEGCLIFNLDNDNLFAREGIGMNLFSFSPLDKNLKKNEMSKYLVFPIVFEVIYVQNISAEYICFKYN